MSTAEGAVPFQTKAWSKAGELLKPKPTCCLPLVLKA